MAQSPPFCTVRKNFLDENAKKFPSFHGTDFRVPRFVRIEKSLFLWWKARLQKKKSMAQSSLFWDMMDATLIVAGPDNIAFLLCLF